MGAFISICSMRYLVSSTSARALSTLARERGDLGLVGSLVQRHGGLLHAQVLLGQAQVDPALLALQAADDLRLRSLQLGALHRVAGGGQVAPVLLGGDAGLGDGLVEGGLGLLERGLLLLQLLPRAAGVEADHRLALLHGGRRRRQPHDAQLRARSRAR